MAGTATTTMPGRYQVFVALNSTTLDPQGRQTINQAAVDWRRTGTAQISVIGHTDTSGRPNTTSACRSAVPTPFKPH